MLKISLLTDLSTSITQIMVKNDEIDNSDNCNDNFDKKFVF